METKNKDSQPPTPVVSTILRDGAIVETLFDAEANCTSFAISQAGTLCEERSLDTPEYGRIIPYSRDNNLLTHGVVLFPSAIGSYESAEALVTDISAFIHRYADLTESFEEVSAYYVLLTWVYDAFSEVPYLRLKGDYGTGKSRCLQTIGSLCYKPMFVSGASTVSPMFRIIDIFRGTLVMDESDFRFSDEKAEIVKIWNNGNAAGFPVLRSEATPTKEYNPRAFVVFGPKIIATRNDFADQALESRCITEVMTGLPPRKDVPLSLPAQFHEEARLIRNKCLGYRFRNLQAFRNAGIERTEGVEARVAQVFGPLLCIVRDEAAKERILTIARGQSGRLQAERSASLDSQLVEIIRGRKSEGIQLGVKDIAQTFSEKYGSDYQRPITAKWIGTQLRKRLSLVPVKSNGVFVLSGNDPKLRALFERYNFGDVPADIETSGMSESKTCDTISF
ncbi:MAG: hypothetical protein JWP08_4029 [Bryobacterales bacterium]|nr:hypothetical protein [Bryobacterales bacterium]